MASEISSTAANSTRLNRQLDDYVSALKFLGQLGSVGNIIILKVHHLFGGGVLDNVPGDMIVAGTCLQAGLCKASKVG